MSYKKRKYILGICLISFGILNGYAWKPELINADKPFIDLSGSIGTSLGNAKNAYNYEHPIEIIVEGEEIKLDNAECSDTEVLESEINKKKIEFEGRKILLIDDYAEAKTYKAVLKVLKDAGITPEFKKIE